MTKWSEISIWWNLKIEFSIKLWYTIQISEVCYLSINDNISLGWDMTHQKCKNLMFVISITLRTYSSFLLQVGPWVVELLGLLCLTHSSCQLLNRVSILRGNKDNFTRVTFHGIYNDKEGNNNKRDYTVTMLQLKWMEPNKQQQEEIRKKLPIYPKFTYLTPDLQQFCFFYFFP